MATNKTGSKDKDFGKGVKSDPVADKAAEKKDKQEKIDAESLDVRKLTLDDFKSVAPESARIPHPFEGYPLRREKVIMLPDPNDPKIKEPFIKEIVTTHIVGLHPSHSVFQDPSNKGVTVGDKEVNLETYHNVWLVNYERGAKNYNIVFDRRLKLDDNMVMRFAFCPDPSIRAQLCFYMDPQSGNMRVNNMYVLLDNEQERRLRNVYRMIYNKVNEAEHLAQKFDNDQESTAADL